MMLSGRKRAMSGGGTTSHCWSEEDVRLSRQAAGQAEAPHLQGGIEGLAAVSGNLASFWSSDELRGGFEAMWRRIAPDERRHLLLSVCPFMPSQRGSTCTREGDDVRGAAWMIPGGT